MSGFCDANREPQERVRPAGWQSCLGRLLLPPRNADSVPQRPWDDAEHAQGSARRPNPTDHPDPRRASCTGALGVGWLPPFQKAVQEDTERYMTAPRFSVYEDDTESQSLY